jgi:RHS repeat-associated protein
LLAFQLAIEKIKGNNNWQIGIVYSSVENGYQGNMVYYTASPGHNIFNFSAPGYIWRIRFLHSNTAQDIEFNLDNFYLEDLTVDSFLKAEADIISATDYSPFGAPLAGRTFQASEYRFSFNGKEKIDEINGAGNDLDFGVRVYDARLGRWLSLDPLQKKYPFNSPYSFCANNPIVYVDYDGRDYRYSIEIITDRNGKSYANISINTTIHAYGKDACKAEEQFHIKGSVIVMYNNKPINATVNVTVNVVAHESKEAAEKFMVNGDNLMRIDESLTDNQMKEFNGEVLDPNISTSGALGIAIRGGKYANSRSVVGEIILHESMHMIGLIDRYLSDNFGLEIAADEGYEGTSMGLTITQRYAKGDYEDLANQVLKDSEKNMKKTDTNKKVSSGVHFGRIFNSISKNKNGPSKSQVEGNK